MELEALFQKATGDHQAGRLAEAQAGYRTLLKAAPNHYVILHYLGLTFFQQNKAERGLDYVRKALALKPDYVEAHYNLATALQGLKRFDDAVGHYNKVLTADPDNA